MRNTEQTNDTDLITTADVARMLDKTVSTVNRMVARGELVPAVKAPGKRGAHLFRRGDIENYAA